MSHLRKYMVVCVIALAFSSAGESMAQDRFALAPILRVGPSARAWGLGGAGTAVSDPFVGFYNPGGLGIYSLEGRAAIVLSRDKQSFNREHDNTLIVVGMPLLRSTGGSHPTRIAIGAAYHKQRFGILNVHFTDGTSTDYIDHADYYTLALAFEHVVQLGVGATYKEFDNAFLQADGTGHGIGVSARIPFFQTLHALNMIESPPQWGSFEAQAAMTFAYTWANRGNFKKKYDSIPLQSTIEPGNSGWSASELKIPIQKDDFYGASAEAGFVRGDATLFHILGTGENWEYKDTDRVQHRWGVEIDLLGILKLRRGWIGTTTASGLALHSKGIARWISVLKTRNGGTGLPWYITNLDVSYQTPSFGPLNTEFADLRVTFDFGSLLGQ